MNNFATDLEYCVSHLILFIDPHQEGFLFVVEYSPSFWPFPLHASYYKIGVARYKEEMVINQLLPEIIDGDIH